VTQDQIAAGTDAAETGGCHCEPGCTDACCRPPVVRDDAWHTAARRAKLLSWLSLSYMAAEGAVALVAALLAGSVALLGFGLDSVIEGLASVIIVWRFSGARTLSETAEARAQKAVAVTFFLLAPYIAYDAVSALAAGEKPSTSWLGIALSVTSLVVMPLLGRAKRRLGAVLGSAATSGEGTQNLLCAYLAAAVLVGLLANALFGLWWLDSAVGLLVAYLAVREGIEAWRGEECAC
jgi:divalent metal cation (Fe/Co/Zn/Cd) transporter